MNTIVKEILAKEEVMRKNLEAQLLQERETIAMNLIAETNEVVEGLGCKHLITTNNVVNNITINKGRIVSVERQVKIEVPVEKIVEKVIEIQVPGPIQVVEDMTKIDELLDTVRAKDSEIDKLKKTIATMQRTINNLKATTETKTVEEQVSDVLANRKNTKKKTIAEELASAPIIEEVGTEISFDNTNSTLVEQPSKKEEIVLVKKTNVNMKSTHVGLYQTDRCFLIASTKNDAITWLSNVVLSDEYKKKVEELLIANHGLMQSRVKTSPVVIEKDNAYIARVEAVNNNGLNFSTDDKLSGYVKIDKEFYLYTYKPSMGKAYVDSLSAKLSGTNPFPEASIKAKVEDVVKELYVQYKAECDKLLTVNEDTKVSARAAMQANRDKRRQQRAAFNVASATSQVSNTKAVDSTTTSTVKSRELQKYVDAF